MGRFARLLLSAVCFAALLGSAPAQGQYPSKPIRIIVPYAPGGLTDVVARLYAEQVPVLWGFGPVTIADHRRDDSMAAIAAHILATAPPRFALVGLSMGGYIAFAMVRQAPGRGQQSSQK